MGLRFCVARSHGVTPYRMIFGRDPQLPSTIKLQNFDVELALSTADQVVASEYVEHLAAYLAALHKEVVEKLALYDSRSKRYYDS